MFKVLPSIKPVAITAARRGRVVEQFYADTIGTVAFKFLLNGGAKPLLDAVISAAQTIGAGGRQKDPRPGTLKADLVETLRELEKPPVSMLASRDTGRTHQEREALARESAELLVKKYWSLRESKTIK